MTSFVILIQNNSNNHKTQAHPFKNKDFKIKKKTYFLEFIFCDIPALLTS